MSTKLTTGRGVATREYGLGFRVLGLGFRGTAPNIEEPNGKDNGNLYGNWNCIVAYTGLGLLENSGRSPIIRIGVCIGAYIWGGP